MISGALEVPVISGVPEVPVISGVPEVLEGPFQKALSIGQCLFLLGFPGLFMSFPGQARE